MCWATYLGIVPYELALDLQERLKRARAEDEVPDVLLLLQHPPVFTLGRFRGENDWLIPPEALAREGIAIFQTDRGGGLTYHGPGQLVGYPILDLQKNSLGVREYIQRLEKVVLELLLSWGVAGYRVPQYPGVWAEGKKVCSIGIHVSRFITTHGFALNVNNDLCYFDYIRPCGLRGGLITSLSELLGHPVEVESLLEGLLHCFSTSFGLNCQWQELQWLAASGSLSG